MTLVEFFAKLEKMANSPEIPKGLSEEDVAELRCRIAEKLDECYQKYFGSTLEEVQGANSGVTMVDISDYDQGIKSKLRKVIITTSTIRQEIVELGKLSQSLSITKACRNKIATLQKKVCQDFQK